MTISKYATSVVENMIAGLSSKNFKYSDVPETIVNGSGIYLLNEKVLVALDRSINLFLNKSNIDDLTISFDSFTWTTTNGDGVIITDSSDDLLRSPESNGTDVELDILSSYVAWLTVYCLSKPANIKWTVELAVKALYFKNLVQKCELNGAEQLISRIDRWVDYLNHLMCKQGYSVSELSLFCSSIFKLSSRSYAAKLVGREAVEEVLCGIFGTTQSTVLFNYTYKVTDATAIRRINDLNEIANRNVDNLVTAFLADPCFPETRDEKNIVGLGFLDIAIRNIIIGGQQSATNYDLDYSKIEKKLLAADAEIGRVWGRYERTIKNPAVLNGHLSYVRKMYYSTNIMLGVANETTDPYLTFLCVYGFVENLITNHKLEKITKLTPRVNKHIIRDVMIAIRDNYDISNTDRTGVSDMIGEYMKNVYTQHKHDKADIDLLIDYIVESKLYVGASIYQNYTPDNSNAGSGKTDINRVIVIMYLMSLYGFKCGVQTVLDIEGNIPGYEDCKIGRLTLEECAYEIFNRVNRLNEIYEHIPSIETVMLLLLAFNVDRGLLNTKYYRPITECPSSPEEETKPGYLDYLAKYVDIFYQVVSEDSRIDPKMFMAKVSRVRVSCKRIISEGTTYLTL